MAKVSEGQKLVERIEAYITRYVALPAEPANQSLVLALWVVHTWVYEHFKATPKLVLTAAVKEAGKTLCMEVLKSISRGGELLATLRPLAMLRVIKMSGGKSTLFVDEAEKIGGAAVGDLRSIFTSSTYQGGEHIITKGEEVSRFRTFSAMCFALIGDVMDVVRSRSIGVHLDRLRPVGDFRGRDQEMALDEALEIAVALDEWSSGFGTNKIPLVQPDHLSGRELEIWSPLWSVATVLGLDGATMDRLVGVSLDLINLKGLPPRTFYSAEAEEGAKLAKDAEQALRDLAGVLRKGKGKENHITSAAAVVALKAIPTSPWRTYRGVGLTADSLVGLLRKTFGVGTQTVRLGSGRGTPTARGFKRDVVIKAVERLEGGDK